MTGQPSQYHSVMGVMLGRLDRRPSVRPFVNRKLKNLRVHFFTKKIRIARVWIGEEFVEFLKVRGKVRVSGPAPGR